MSEKLFVQDKEVVVPGEILAEGMSYLPGNGTYRTNDKIVANRLGLLTIEGKVMKTVPLAGRYLPKRNDVIIGRVMDILMSGWRVDISSPYTAVLPLKDATFSYIEKGDDLTRYFELDDYLVCKITNVTSQNLVDVSCKGPGLQRLKGGRIIHVNAQKVPRIIGKRGSMVSMIKHATGCKITVGQNGLVWLLGEPDMESLAVNAMRFIEEKSHLQGLTEMVKSFLEEKTGKTIDLSAIEPEGEEYSEENHGSDGDGENRGYRSYGGNGDRGERRERSGGFRDRGDRYAGRGGDRNERGGGFRDRPRREYSSKPFQEPTSESVSQGESSPSNGGDEN